MHKQIIPILIASSLLVLTGCKSNKKDNPVDPVDPVDPPADSTEEITVRFNGENSRSNLSGGSDLNNSGPKAAFTALFNANITGFMTGYSSSAVFMTYYQDEQNSSLCIGSGSSGGSISLNFSYEIVSISFEIQAYCKFITYNNSYTGDTASSVTIAGTNYSLARDDVSTGLSTPETHSLDFDTPITKLDISNANGKQRTYINYITFTYKTK